MPDRTHAGQLVSIKYAKKGIVSDNPTMKSNIQLNEKLKWQWYDLQDMEPVLLYDMLALREAIFVVEQTCVYLELDGLDKAALHLVAIHGDELLACLRLLPPDKQNDGVRIGRVAVSAKWRTQGIARMMVQKAIEKTRSAYPSATLYLHAQTYLQNFYNALGFEVCGAEFLEHGIPHIPMQRKYPG